MGVWPGRFSPGLANTVLPTCFAAASVLDCNDPDTLVRDLIVDDVGKGSQYSGANVTSKDSGEFGCAPDPMNRELKCFGKPLSQA